MVDRDVLLAYAHDGVAAAAFVVGLLDASLDAINAQEMPGQTRSIGFWYGRPVDLI